MGMDVYGLNPTAPEGEYFRASIWKWRPLADLCLDLAPENCSACVYWQSNDGDELDGDGAAALGDQLERFIATGVVASYIAERDTYLRNLADEPCRYCGATGVRTDSVGAAQNMPEKIVDSRDHPRHGQTGWCNACDGRGANRPSSTWYYLEAQDVGEFAAFLKACGGFEIR